MKNKRVFNYRPLCFVALFLFVTLVMALINFWALVVWLIILLVIVGFFFKSKRLAIMVLTVIFLSLGSFFLTTQSFENSRVFAGSGYLQGTILSHNINDATHSGNFVLGDVTFRGEPVRGRVRVFANAINWSSNRAIDVGNIVYLYTDISNAQTSNFNVNNRIRYTTSIWATQIYFAGENTNARFTIMRASNEFLHRFMSPNSAELVYSMLFGDRSEIESGVVQVFSASGIGHVLAVSGLHVALLMGIFMFILSAVKFPRKWQIPILFAILGFYVYLVDFRYSVLRAAIMFMTVLIFRSQLRKVDLLSSICFAAILILIIFPYGLLSVSFIMSFGCLIGIAMFHRPIDNWTKQRIMFLPKPLAHAIAGSVAITLAATAMVLPILINYFGFVGTFTLLSNLILLPILVLAFQMSIVALITVIAFPLLWVSSFLIDTVVAAGNWLISIPWSVIRMEGSGYFYLLFFIALILSSRFIFANRRAKFLAFAVFMLGYLTTIAIANL